MKPRTWLGAVVAVVLSFTAAGAEVVGVCTLANGNKKQCVEFRPRATPLPSPVPTRSPSPRPTEAFECSDGTFSKLANGFLSKDVVPEPGRTFELCFTLPPAKPGAYGAMRLDSASASDTSCDIYELKLTSPSGEPYRTDGPTVVQGTRHEAGRWRARLTLDPKLGPVCAGRHGLEMWVSWY